MRNPRLFILAIVLLMASFSSGVPRVACAAGGAAKKTEVATSARPLRVLFIGNSYTYVNDLPALVKRLLAGRGVALDCGQVTTGGATLERHWKEGKALKAIRQGKWDFVVLQEQSMRPFRDREAMFRYARLFNEEIRKTGARTLLYETWAAKKAPEEQPKLTDAYETLGRELGATVVPAGEAWKRAVAKGVALHGGDGRHPNLQGSYLAACAFVRVLDGAQAVQMAGARGEGDQAVPGVARAQAEALQRIADEVAGLAGKHSR